MAAAIGERTEFMVQTKSTAPGRSVVSPAPPPLIPSNAARR